MNIAERFRFVYRAWRYRWNVERQEIAFLLDQLRPGQTAIDIGAHKGAFTHWMQRAVGPTGNVIAFEPQPELVHYLQRVKESFGFTQVAVVNAALSSSSGMMPLYRPGNSPSPAATLAHVFEGGDVIPVQVLTLDQFLSDHDARPVRLVKCDVEGHELEVLQGAESILREDRPTLLLECEQRHQHDRDVREVFAYLAGLGYTGRFFRGGEMRPLSEFQPERNASPDTRDYVYNFAFGHCDVA